MKTAVDTAMYWDSVLNYLYDKDSFIKEFKNSIKKLGINKKSRIFDVAAGTGFLTLDLIKDGYNIQVSDASKKMLQLLKKNARRLGIDNIEVINIPWQFLSKKIDKEYDLVLCRGNSLVYVKSWDKKVSNFIRLKDDIKISLQNFYDLLKQEGTLWIDITSDDEIARGPKLRETFARNSDGSTIKSIWKITHDIKRRIRKVKMETHFDSDNIKHMHTFTSYFMTSDELIALLKGVGFKKVAKINLKNEIYTVLTATK